MFLGGKVSKSVTVPGRNLSESNDKSWPGFGTRSRSQESRVLSGGGVFFFWCGNWLYLMQLPSSQYRPGYKIQIDSWGIEATKHMSHTHTHIHTQPWGDTPSSSLSTMCIKLTVAGRRELQTDHRPSPHSFTHTSTVFTASVYSFLIKKKKKKKRISVSFGHDCQCHCIFSSSY